MKVDGANLSLEFQLVYNKPEPALLNLEFSVSYNSNLRAVTTGNNTLIPKPNVRLVASFLRVKGFRDTRYGLQKSDRDTPKIKPVGIESTSEVSAPAYVSWRKFAYPDSIGAPTTPLMVYRVRSLGGYNAPFANGLNLNWSDVTYTPPSTINLNIEFGSIGYSSLILTLGEQTQFGSHGVSKQLAIAPEGDSYQVFGNPALETTKGMVLPAMGDQSLYGKPYLSNAAAPLLAKGFDELKFGTAFLELFIRYVKAKSHDPLEMDNPFVKGGVRFLVLKSGISSLVFGELSITRQREDQYIRLFNYGIKAIDLSEPRVDPRIIYPFPLLATLWGSARVERNPSPLGFVNTRYGIHWITLGQRFLNPRPIASFVEGYPKVFDPTQFIYQQLKEIPNGIFGDTLVRNKNHYVNVDGSIQEFVSEWSFVESNLRHIVSRVDNIFTITGDATIHNKTPNLSPFGIVGGVGKPSISYYKQTILVSGFDLLRLGKPFLKKTPQLDVRGFSLFVSGDTFISNYMRNLDANGFAQTKIGIPIIWHYTRYINNIGEIKLAESGKPELTLGLRSLLMNGYTNSVYGKPELTFYVRQIEPKSIIDAKKDNTNHTVGGTQYLSPKGYEATYFGERIIPVSQVLYAYGFTGIYPVQAIKNYKIYVKPFSFNSDNIPIHGRWGKAKTFNSRQYVTMFYDVDSELNPPKENSKWLNIINRNRTMQFYGSTATIYGRPSIANKAVAILPPGIDSAAVDNQRISYYRQVVKIESMEPPYISGWSNVSNDAKVVDAKQFHSAIFGKASLENTRKFYKIQGYENQVLGYPMVAFKIRELTFENRYSIAPVRIELPRVQLWIRYVEPVSIFKEAFGSIELFRYQGRLTTRWSHKEYTGEPIIRNVTPELKVWSMLSEEFGKPSIELLRRYVTKDGFVATLLPKPRIEFKTRNLQMRSIPALNISQKHVLERIGSQPYAKQWISLEHPDVGYYDDIPSTVGYGIPIPGESHHGVVSKDMGQVPMPNINQMVIRQLHINDNNGDMAKIGNPMISANTVRINSGIGAFDAGEAFVSLKNRRIVVEEFPNSEVFQPSPAALSPWTIYAVIEAPEQARRNHPGRGSPQLVRSESVVGYPTLTLRHRKVAQYSSNQSLFGVTSITLYRRYIGVSGFNTFRFGFHSIPEWVRTVEQHASRDVSLYGYPEVSRPKELVKLSISPRGINAPLIGAPLIEFFHRKFQMNGIDSAKFGASVKGDAEYYPQHLYVGFKKPVIPQGTDCAKYGKNLISYLHRQVSAEGFNAFVSTYTIEKFKERLKVTLVKKPQVITNQVIGVLGIENQNYSTPDIKLAVHYIRPDGNSDQFRKGAPQ